jgi:hypothetical protein
VILFAGGSPKPDRGGNLHWFTRITDRRRWYTLGAAAAWLLAAFGYLILEAIAADAFTPRYSYPRDFISNLGVPSESALADVMNTAFCLQGTLFLLGALLIVGALRTGRNGAFLPLALANAVGNVMVAAVHGGATAHADGSIWLHEFGALLAIVGGNATILVASTVVAGAGEPPWLRRIPVGLAAFGLLSFVLLIIEMQFGAIRILPPAVWERASVYSITAGQVCIAAYLLTRPPLNPLRSSGMGGA